MLRRSVVIRSGLTAALAATTALPGFAWAGPPAPLAVNTSSHGVSLRAVSALSPTLAWAVGYDALSNPLIERWDGTRWHPADNPIGTMFYLAAVDARTSTDVWAVGSEPSGGQQLTFVTHWDGAAWTQVPSRTPTQNAANLTGVTAVGPDDVWAVGWTATPRGAFKPLAEHWDGARWSVVSTHPMSPDCGGRLDTVASTGPDDVWAAGTTPCSRGVIEHWDGSTWTRVHSPRNPHGWDFSLDSITAVTPSDVWIVGSTRLTPGGSRIGTLTEHWDGSRWTVVNTPAPRLPECTAAFLTSASAVGTRDVWAVGWAGCDRRYHVLRTLALHWNGAQWHQVRVPGGGGEPPFDELKGVSAVSSTVAWTVGWGENRSCDTVGVVDSWSGTRWSRQ
jgi:hypothetical protein